MSGLGGRTPYDTFDKQHARTRLDALEGHDTRGFVSDKPQRTEESKRDKEKDKARGKSPARTEKRANHGESKPSQNPRSSWGSEQYKDKLPPKSVPRSSSAKSKPGEHKLKDHESKKAEIPSPPSRSSTREQTSQPRPGSSVSEPKIPSWMGTWKQAPRNVEDTFETRFSARGVVHLFSRQFGEDRMIAYDENTESFSGRDFDEGKIILHTANRQGNALILIEKRKGGKVLPKLPREDGRRYWKLSVVYNKDVHELAEVPLTRSLESAIREHKVEQFVSREHQVSQYM